jgi:V8-like Glu-specific endopeptidase
MGTGWLIREDLVVTAGHNVYSNTYGGQAQRIKCWIGYRGRKHASAPGVQHRQALNIVTTASWRSNKSDRRRDVALIQVSTPFEGQLKLFRFINTDTKVTNQQMTVVGYPGDKSIKDENGNDDPGAEMWFHTESITFDLEKNGMIAYDIDTFGGENLPFRKRFTPNATWQLMSIVYRTIWGAYPLTHGKRVARYRNALLWRRWF